MSKLTGKMKNAVVLLSGGVDSTTILHYVRKKLGIRRVYALSFLYGQKHFRELAMAKWQAKAVNVAEHRVIDLSFFGELIAGSSALTDKSISVPDLKKLEKSQKRQPPTYVPNRNMVFIALAAAYAEAKGVQDVFYGAQAQDEYGYWDCTVDFVRKINDVLRLNRCKAIRVNAPFAGLCKTAVVKTGLELGVDYTHTWSCYCGGKKPCGTCPSCVEREKAFLVLKGE
ncbi:MAG: 7-cyano-7-deazaguanine synthase QueC [Kiritimatiellae bacterium]|nr:7-cyano-7-deazaguanine synthase QueC [Kiritimatiellia bacterium]MDD5521390.1 7-cyano-7-deazaguanine synthase QueC [Kiritimatiellia bacterium]